MKRTFPILFVFFVVGPSWATPNHVRPDAPFDQYGRISWKKEKARLDNFAMQLMSRPELIGVLLVRVGKQSCRDEAQAHALRAKHYLMNVSHIPWNRVMWRDIGFGGDFRITMWLAPRGTDLTFYYDRASDQHVIRDCRRTRVTRNAPNKALQLTARCVVLK